MRVRPCVRSPLIPSAPTPHFRIGALLRLWRLSVLLWLPLLRTLRALLALWLRCVRIALLALCRVRFALLAALITLR